jgi:hypothetical protein
MEKYLLPCAYKSLFGIDCPICGFQRSLLLLIKGNIKESFLFYPPLIPSLLLIVFVFLYLINNNIVTRKFLLYYSSIVLTIVAINYLIKITS